MSIEEISRAACNWGPEGVRVERASATARCDRRSLGEPSALALVFDSPEALQTYVRGWDSPYVGQRSCSAFWFNPQAGLRAERPLRSADGACKPDAHEGNVLYLAPYQPLEKLLVQGAKRFFFEPEEPLLGLSRQRVHRLYEHRYDPRRELIHLPVIEDGWHQTTIQLHFRDDVVRKYELHSAHSPGRVDQRWLADTFVQQFGNSASTSRRGGALSFEGPPAVTVSPTANEITVTDTKMCPEPHAEHSRELRAAFPERWIQKQAANQADSSRFTVRLPGDVALAGNVALVEERPAEGDCGTRYWTLIWNKPDCDEEEFEWESAFEECCGSSCPAQPEAPLYELLSAVTDRKWKAIRRLLAPQGARILNARGVQVARITPGALGAESLEHLPSWKSRVASSGIRGCAPVSDRDATVRCTLASPGHNQELTFEDGRLVEIQNS